MLLYADRPLLEMAAQRVMEDPALALCEAITHTLLLFCEQRDVARILLTDLPRHSPQQAERQQRSNQRFQYIVEQILAQMAQAGVLQVSSQKEAHVMAVSLMGGLYYAISVALDEASSTDDLLAYAYPLTLYNLRALAIAHDAQAVHATICRIIKEGSKP